MGWSSNTNQTHSVMKLDFGSLPSRLGKALQGVFGSANKRALSQYNPLIKAVNDLGDWAKDLSEEQVKAEIAGMKASVQSGELTLDDAMPKVFALSWLYSDWTASQELLMR